MTSSASPSPSIRASSAAARSPTASRASAAASQQRVERPEQLGLAPRSGPRASPGAGCRAGPRPAGRRCAARSAASRTRATSVARPVAVAAAARARSSACARLAERRRRSRSSPAPTRIVASAPPSARELVGERAERGAAALELGRQLGAAAGERLGADAEPLVRGAQRGQPAPDRGPLAIALGEALLDLACGARLTSASSASTASRASRALAAPRSAPASSLACARSSSASSRAAQLARTRARAGRGCRPPGPGASAAAGGCAPRARRRAPGRGCPGCARASAGRGGGACGACRGRRPPRSAGGGRAGFEWTISSTRPWLITECISRPRFASASASITSTRRQRAPFSRYSPSPLRSSRRVIEISENSLGRAGAVGSCRCDDLDLGVAARRLPSPPAKIMSCIVWPRTAERALLAERPEHGVGDVRLAAAVRADDHADARREHQPGALGEGLEALDRDRAQMHVGGRQG